MQRATSSLPERRGTRPGDLLICLPTLESMDGLGIAGIRAHYGSLTAMVLSRLGGRLDFWLPYMGGWLTGEQEATSV